MSNKKNVTILVISIIIIFGVLAIQLVHIFAERWIEPESGEIEEEVILKDLSVLDLNVIDESGAIINKDFFTNTNYKLEADIKLNALGGRGEDTINSGIVFEIFKKEPDGKGDYVYETISSSAKTSYVQACCEAKVREDNYKQFSEPGTYLLKVSVLPTNDINDDINLLNNFMTKEIVLV